MGQVERRRLDHKDKIKIKWQGYEKNKYKFAFVQKIIIRYP